MEPESSNLFDLVIDQPINSLLVQTAKWGKFISIVGFIMAGLIILFGLFFTSFMGMFFHTLPGNSFGGSESGLASTLGAAYTVGMAIVYVLIGAFMILPCLFLYRFSTKMRTALAANDQQVLTESFSNLKSLYKFYGVLLIVVLSLYALIFVVAIVGMMFR